MTDFSKLTMFRSKRIEQCAVNASHRPQHVRGVHQCGYEKSRHLCRGVVLGQSFLNMREDQFDRPRLVHCRVADVLPPEPYMTERQGAASFLINKVVVGLRFGEIFQVSGAASSRGLLMIDGLE